MFTVEDSRTSDLFRYEHLCSSMVSENRGAALILAIAARIIHIIVWSFGVVAMWRWHMVPLGMPPITHATAWGARFLWSAFDGVKTSGLDKDNYKTWFSQLIMFGLWVFVAWLIRP